jgi:hypothetical protein
MSVRSKVACALVACLAINVSRAHHGLDFLLVQTAHLPERGTGYLAARLDHISEARDESEFEPAVLYGATDWMTVELHAHYEKEEGESSKYESVAPAFNFRLTPREQAFSVGISAEYEIAHASDDEDVVEMAAIFGYEMDQWIVTGNVLYERSSGVSGEWGYAAGVRHTFGQKHGLGLELLGSLESGGSSEMLVGYYGEFSERFTFNAGIGAGIDEGPDNAARMAFIWRFK